MFILYNNDFFPFVTMGILNLVGFMLSLVQQEYGDNVEIDGFDVDYGVRMIDSFFRIGYSYKGYCNCFDIFWVCIWQNEVLTLKLGDLGIVLVLTYFGCAFDRMRC